MNIKLDRADIVFSKYIRRRDGKCVRCGRLGTGPKGIVGLQASHFFGRARETTRYDPGNVDALCFGCHQLWGSTNREDYRAFKLRQLGQVGFTALSLAANSVGRKDRKLALIVAKALLASLPKPE